MLLLRFVVFLMIGLFTLPVVAQKTDSHRPGVRVGLFLGAASYHPPPIKQLTLVGGGAYLDFALGPQASIYTSIRQLSLLSYLDQPSITLSDLAGLYRLDILEFRPLFGVGAALVHFTNYPELFVEPEVIVGLEWEYSESLTLTTLLRGVGLFGTDALSAPGLILLSVGGDFRIVSF
ncbi:hypothetical protein KAI87_11855 [Myxococcota bacterium]|nr:hypothetical protein [Myxococcota bacterium]